MRENKDDFKLVDELTGPGLKNSGDNFTVAGQLEDGTVVYELTDDEVAYLEEDVKSAELASKVYVNMQGKTTLSAWARGVKDGNRAEKRKEAKKIRKAFRK